MAVERRREEGSVNYISKGMHDVYAPAILFVGSDGVFVLSLLLKRSHCSDFTRLRQQNNIHDVLSRTHDWWCRGHGHERAWLN